VLLLAVVVLTLARRGVVVLTRSPSAQRAHVAERHRWAGRVLGGSWLRNLWSLPRQAQLNHVRVARWARSAF
jgi:hypothetical protein